MILQEFFQQSDTEKLEGLPVTPFMDREKITKPSSQCSFIGIVLLPLFEALASLFTELEVGLFKIPIISGSRILQLYFVSPQFSKKKETLTNTLYLLLIAAGDPGPSSIRPGLLPEPKRSSPTDSSPEE
jgi:hypothetical protein